MVLPSGQADENDARGWAYRPPVRPAVPAAPGGYNPVDAFIHSRLSQVGLEMSPPADRLTLLRRVTFDLTGLPPTPAEQQLEDIPWISRISASRELRAQVEVYAVKHQVREVTPEVVERALGN